MENEFQPGQVISFRLPANTPHYVLQYLAHVKQTEGRGFSKKVAQLFIDGAYRQHVDARPALLLHLPNGLEAEHINWLNQANTKELIGNWISQLAVNPAEAIRAIQNGLIGNKQDTPTGELGLPANEPDKSSEFQISTAYHAKLVSQFFDV